MTEHKIPEDLQEKYGRILTANYSGGAHLTCAELRELIERIAALQVEVERLQYELGMVDEALARRPALADSPSRYAAIHRACNLAGEASKAEAERDLLRKQLRKMQETVTQAEADVDWYAAIVQEYKAKSVSRLPQFAIGFASDVQYRVIAARAAKAKEGK